MRAYVPLFATLSLVFAAPAPTAKLSEVINRIEAIFNSTILATDVPAVVQKLFQAVQPLSSPTSIQDAIDKAASAFGISSAAEAPTLEQNILANVLTLVLDGFTSSDIQAAVSGITLHNPFTSSYANDNEPVPDANILYNTVQGDAPFSVFEAQLRAALYIPPSFTYGQKQPILMSPGTGVTGFITFQSNIGKLLSQEAFADPVYLNVPNELLSDAQISAEYVAYGLQYIYAITSTKPAIVTWSQGSLDAQWAFKYWPSVTEIVTDHIAISTDYHGTILAYAVCPGFALGDAIACAPSVMQQEYNSAFVTKLRENGGDSAYVPTTTVYSLTDEMVQLQTGTEASGYINDIRNFGASNTFLQGACVGDPAGGVYTHEDALQHSGPGNFSRVSASCRDIVTPGLSLVDVVATEALVPLAVLNMLTYLPESSVEPPIKSYATF